MVTATLTPTEVVAELPENFATDTPKKKRGGQPGNGNGIQHGLYCAKPTAWISEYGNRQINLFRRKLAELVKEKFSGELPMLEAALLQTAVEMARCAVANREILAAAPAGVSIETRMALDREYIKFLDARDRKLRELGIGPGDVPGSIGRSDRLDFNILPAPADPSPANATADDPPSPPAPASPPSPESNRVVSAALHAASAKASGNLQPESELRERFCPPVDSVLTAPPAGQ
jgi:hypothetical protein